MRPRTALAAAFGLALLAAAGACSAPEATPPAPPPAREDLARLGEESGIHNLAEVAPGLLRGSQPEGDGAFALLARLGVRTVLSVDGARPDAEGAARHGLRYVHLPLEYSGITREEVVRIAKVARDLPGGLLVHCHHGKHRGPAAVAIAWMARDAVTPGQAVEEMHRAGTDPLYEGLYGAAAAFVPPTAEELGRVRDEALAPAAAVPDLVEAMVAVDATFGRMKAVQKAGWAAPSTMPDVRPPHEARILAERFRELARLDEVRGRPGDFRGWLEGAEKGAWELEAALRGGDGPAAAEALSRVAASCNSCHDAYRNHRR